MKFLIGVLGVVATSVAAEPVVIADCGGEPTGFTVPDIAQVPVAGDIPVQRYTIKPTFPMRSSLRPGLVSPHSHGYTIVQPIFIIGADEDSLRWLDANHDVLVDKGVLGFVTNIDSAASLDLIRRSYPALEFTTLPVDEIARQYRLKHYPVLIDHKEILQ